MRLGTIQHSSRGFPFIEFKDAYDTKCSIQQSSNAEFDALWIGISEADPKVMATDAASVGVRTAETTGWVAFPIPPEVFVATRMHLEREQVEALVEDLTRWLKTGELA